MLGTPFRFKSLARDAEHLLLGGIIDKEISALGIDSHDDNIMKRNVRPAGFQADDQGPSLLQIVLQITPLSSKGESAISRILKIRLHTTGGNSGLCGREQCLLDFFGVREFRRRLSLLFGPILKHHGNGGRSAPIFYLWNEGDIDPEGRGFRSTRETRTRRGCQQQTESNEIFHDFSEQRQ